MSNDFFNLPIEHQSILINKAGQNYGMPDNIIEKDLWMCWLLDKLFQLPELMAFKGGTSLSKVFGLIDRYSEDIDIIIDYVNFNNSLDITNTSRSQLKKIAKELKESLEQYINDKVQPHLLGCIEQSFPYEHFEIKVSENCEQLHFYYPSMIDTEDNYIKDHIFLEFCIRNNTEPCDSHKIAPFLSEIIEDNLIIPSPVIQVLSPLRTLWEKATLIHLECNRGRLTSSPERLSRHWYDLYKLGNSWVGEEALANRHILDKVIEHKRAFFNASYANYEKCTSNEIMLVPDNHGRKALEEDFKQMRQAGMFQKNPPPFDDIMEYLENFEKLINHI